MTFLSFGKAASHASASTPASGEGTLSTRTPRERDLGLGETFSHLFSKFAGVGRKGKFRRNLQAPGKIVAKLGSGIRTVVKTMVGEQQLSALADYIRAALMLRFNDRTVG